MRNANTNRVKCVAFFKGTPSSQCEVLERLEAAYERDAEIFQSR